ncbi:class I SAM-dependent methyltransferase [Glycomyces buryatensis]|uniref:Methyltransferase domain-containing protein n=1 Tax=Glycomyces buryatensis TaxID=2570927 RepID=A0A4S8Q751_9ACTN|nr:methyltransferase domain-containing protein [Glycomyces buryatensis]THV40207.1 methyltransferase domain-containing protein [Glycomyces buryatensis]
MTNKDFLDRSYEVFAEVEEEFKGFLDEGLEPRGPEMLYELASGLGIRGGGSALDIGCGEGRHSIALASRFGLRVKGIDPVPRHIELARRDLSARAQADPGVSDAVSFESGRAEAIPAGDASVDLIWCRDVLVHVEELSAAYAEFRRVLAPGGRVLVYQMFCTELMEPREADRLLPTMGCVEANMRPDYAEAAMRTAGLRIDECIVLGTEWGQYGQEHSGKGGRNLLHAARLIQNPDRYIERFGRENYDIALGDCLWHVYRLIGKLSDRVYVLSAADRA